MRRYQLNKSSEAILRSGHPWILTGNISSAASVFKDGDWLRLVSGLNEVLGFGIYSAYGPIGIRILQRGGEFSLSTLRNTLLSALEKRKHLRSVTDAYRILHGENDEIPGITVDKYANTWVVQIYSKSLYRLARLVTRLLYSASDLVDESKPARILLISPHRTGDAPISAPRFLRGSSPLPFEEKITIKDLTFKVKIPGQKGGLFLDVRNLRIALLEKKELAQDRNCLHLFCHTGLTSLCMQSGGARSVVSIDGSRESLSEFASQLTDVVPENAFEQKNAKVSIGIHELIRADLFKAWDFLERRKFELIVLDPPNLAPTQASIPSAKKAYRALIIKSLEHLEPGGDLVFLSCSGRIPEKEFEKIGRESMASQGWNYKNLVRLSPEPDHPIRKEFPEGSYFKVHLYLNVNRLKSYTSTE
ncbi:S-adenosylmethionine-dependent methyltransferase [Leptospira inadai serovar Lyme str. 10]|uniref:S-adenosylmethionine-dependent methyltransferase n=1 Tax=Leptospira inadai serovar Lyme str. 10 TaxID=1049790 RepID=V6HCF8_9LEPT|nr:S-adenosylmethionine-dependent methyltransferase [Leptospira inadai serovar Lyme str. 10]